MSFVPDLLSNGGTGAALLQSVGRLPEVCSGSRILVRFHVSQRLVFVAITAAMRLERIVYVCGKLADVAALVTASQM